MYYFFFVHCIHFPFFSMMSCHVVSLISKAFLLFRDTFDDRSVVTSYFLFVLAWLLSGFIYSCFKKLLILLNSGFKSWVVVNFFLSQFYVKELFSKDLTIILWNSSIKRHKLITHFSLLPWAAQTEDFGFQNVFINQLYIKLGVTLPLCKEYHFCSFEVSLKRSLYLEKQCCWIHIWSCLNLKPSIFSHSRPCKVPPMRLLICFVLQHSAIKTKHLRSLVRDIVQGFEWLEILSFRLFGAILQNFNSWMTIIVLLILSFKN